MFKYKLMCFSHNLANAICAKMLAQIAIQRYLCQHFFIVFYDDFIVYLDVLKAEKWKLSNNKPIFLINQYWKCFIKEVINEKLGIYTSLKFWYNEFKTQLQKFFSIFW